MQLIKTLASLAVIALLALGTEKLVHYLAPVPAALPAMAVPVDADTAIAGVLSTTLVDSRGTPKALSQWQGRPLLINFWASWCAPCLEEMPQLDAVAREQPADGLQILGIALDRADNVADFERKHPTHYPLLVADERIRDILPALGNAAQGIPFSVLIDAEGHVRHIRLGVLHASELKKWLQAVNVHSEPNGAKKK
jgi:thiol-disulfide isomerase/thioredoxin